MLKVLRRMRKFYNYDAWMVYVDQAHDRGKITDAEYEELKDEAVSNV